MSTPGNQHARKPVEEKLSCYGRTTIDLGPFKAAVKLAAKKKGITVTDWMRAAVARALREG